MNKWCEKEIAEIIEAVANCKKPEDVCELFEVVLTPREINDIARRYKIAKMLKEGLSYSDIKMKLGISSDVISRVAAGIGYGFRRSNASLEVKDTSKAKRQDHYRRRHYKGTPTPLTIIRDVSKTK